MKTRRKDSLSPEALRDLIEAAMDLERRTMQLYCRFEALFDDPDEVRTFWFDMAQHESTHFGALALVVGLLEGSPARPLHAVASLTPARIEHLRTLLDHFDAEAQKEMSLARAFEMALDIESSELEDVVLDLLSTFKGESERERAVRLLIHDLGDLGYMIEKYTTEHALLARADALLETRVDRLHRKSTRQQLPLRQVKG